MPLLYALWLLVQPVKQNALSPEHYVLYWLNQSGTYVSPEEQILMWEDFCGIYRIVMPYITRLCELESGVSALKHAAACTSLVNHVVAGLGRFALGHMLDSRCG